jgi:hypothetical protein
MARDPQPIPAEFFEEYYLLRKCECYVPSESKGFESERWYPPITMSCDICSKPQTFRASKKHLDSSRMEMNLKEYERAQDQEPPDEEAELTKPLTYISPPLSHKSVPFSECVIVIDFRCTGCNTFFHKFIIAISKDCRSIRKIGQYPLFSPKQNAIAKYLDKEHLDYCLLRAQ